MRRTLVALALLAATGCAPEAEATCDTFVEAWTRYDVRCGVSSGVESSRDPSDADRGGVEADFFGSEGCASATLDDFRDARALRDECTPALDELECDAIALPDVCDAQILR